MNSPYNVASLGRCLALLLLIPDVLGSNLCTETDYTDRSAFMEQTFDVWIAVARLYFGLQVVIRHNLPVNQTSTFLVVIPFLIDSRAAG